MNIHKIKPYIFLLVVIFVAVYFYPDRKVHAATTITAASCNQGDVNIAMSQLQAGDTLQIPSGTCHWTSRYYWVVPANVTIKGAGDLSVLGGGDHTIIVDDNTTDTTYLFSIETNGSGTFRLSGITVSGGAGVIKEVGMVAIGGYSKQMRLDHLHVSVAAYSNHVNSKSLRFGGWLNGVVDHSIVDLGSIGQAHFSSSLYGTGIENSGDQSFAAPTNFGSSDFIFWEDNLLNGQESSSTPGLYMSTGNDCNAGGRFVMRFNTVYSASVGQTHPTGGGMGGRGCRAHELYQNNVLPLPTFNPAMDTPGYTFSWISSGTALVWGNTANGVFKQFMHLDSMRKDDSTYAQIPTPNGFGYCGTTFSGVGSNWDGNTNTASGYPCMDQPGQGQSDLLTGEFPTRINSLTGTISWPHQKLEPIYEWNNAFTAVPGWGNDSSTHILVASGAENRLAENRDYYQYTSSFNGSSGVGSGTLSARPSTCTTGVAYWATDAGGNWNTINSTANDGALYKCSSTNTWTLYYTPYTYPHPLVSGTSTPPSTLQGDLNGDHIVNSLDWSIMNSKWFTSDATADINKDGIVNTLDWSIMNSNWFKTG